MSFHTKAYLLLCRVCLHHYLWHPLALSHLVRSSLCQFSLIFNTDHTLYNRSRLCHFSYVLDDFGHYSHVPYVSCDFGHDDHVSSFLCFRWFRSWRSRPILCMFQVISVIATASHMFQVILVMATASRSFYVSGDFGHCDRVPTVLGYGDSIPFFFFFFNFVIWIIVTSSHPSLILGVFSHGNRVQSFL